MHRVFKPQNVRSLSEAVAIPDYIPPKPPIIEMPETEMEEEALKEKCSEMILKAQQERENRSEEHTSELQSH